MLYFWIFVHPELALRVCLGRRLPCANYLGPKQDWPSQGLTMCKKDRFFNRMNLHICQCVPKRTSFQSVRCIAPSSATGCCVVFSNLAWTVRVSLALALILMPLSLQSSWSISVSIQLRSRFCILFCHVVATNRLVTGTGCQLFKQCWSDQLKTENCKLFEGMFLGHIFNIFLCAHFTSV